MPKQYHQSRPVKRSKGYPARKPTQRSSGRDRRVGIEGAIDVDRSKPGVSSEIFDREDAAQYRRLAGQARSRSKALGRTMGPS